ncbi:MAG: CDP-diacylglycerol--glycerol-3-phosphate 3-phosphatidyltransferase [Thermodesulfobacteriota bacterium]
MTEAEYKGWNIPNLLSLFRIGVVPVLIIVLLSPGRILSVFSALLFSVASITDWLDGYIARRYNAVSSVGKFLDPLADKILISTCLIMLVSLNRVPAWMVALIICREMIITGIRSIAVTEGIMVEVSKMGKYKTFFQIAAIIGLLLHYPFWGIDFQTVGGILIWIAFVLTIWSGTKYLLKFLEKLKRR